MKTFYEFDPLHPFQFAETLQIKNRKVFLSYIPLVDSVSIRGFLQADSPSDVVSNSFWCDYRFQDGYRSANGEIIFDSSQNDHFVEISYLGVGTVLHAQDMNEVADSLDSLDKSRNNSQSDVQDLSIRAGVIESNAIDSLNSHNSNPDAHLQLQNSIKSSKDEFDYRLNTFNSILNALQSQISSSNDSIKSQFLNLISQFESSLHSVESEIKLDFQTSLSSIDDYRDEFTGVYNRLDNLNQRVQSNHDSTLQDVQSILDLERISATTALNNAKSEILSRSIAEAERLDQSLLANIRANFGSDFSRVDDLEDSLLVLDSKFDSIPYQFNEIDERLNSEQINRISTDNEIFNAIDSVYTYYDDKIESIDSNVAFLADTLYQARQATNNQIESLRANVAIAEDRMLYISERLETLQIANVDLNESLASELEGVTSMKSEMMDYVDGMFDPLRLEIANSVETALNSIDFSPVESSIATIWDSLENIDFDTTPIEQSLNALQTSISNLDISMFESSIASLQDSLENIDFSPVETSISNLQDSLENIDFSPVESSISSNTSSIQSNTSSISALDSRVSVLEVGGVSDLQVLTTSTSNTTGAIWYTA